MEEKVESNKNNIIQLITMCLLPIVTVGIFAPMEIYLTNISEFWFRIVQLLPLLGLVTIVALIAILAFVLIINRLNSRCAGVIAYILAILGILLYVQGNYANGKMAALNGNEVDWNAFLLERVLSFILWIGGIVIAVLLYLKSNKRGQLFRITSIICGCIIAVEVVTIVSLTVVNRVELASNNSASYRATSKGETSLSKDENFIILVLDTFDSSFFEEVLDSELEEELADFTYYPNTLGSYSHTDLAIPQILTGIGHKNDCRYADYTIRAYDESPLLNALYEDNYGVGLYSSITLPICKNITNAENVVQTNILNISSKRRFLKCEYELVGYKYLPYELKRLCWFYPDEFNTLIDAVENTSELYDDNNGCFADVIPNISGDSDNKEFRLYHIKGMHSPYITLADGSDSDVTTSFDEARDGNLSIVNNFIKQLKEIGAYDNSVIFIMADHGGSVDDVNQINQNPLLLVKGRNETHEFQISDASVTYLKLQDAMLALLEGEDSDSALNKSTDDIRYFYDYVWELESESDTYFKDIVEYRLEGDASDASNLIATGNVYKYNE